MQSDFEKIKHIDANGKPHWSARQLYSSLGYSTFQKFGRILEKARNAMDVNGIIIGDHFNQTVEMVQLGSGTFRKV